MSVPLAVFASGSGTNLQALIDHARERDPSPYDVTLVVSDREGAGALERARSAGAAARVVPVPDRPADEVARETLEALEGAGAEMVALAGYLRLVPAPVVEAYRGRILNIHPALLPAFGGKGMYGRRVHEAVLASGARVSGPTVHRVNEEYDEGTIVAQWPVPVRSDDTPESLAARVLEAEHILYPAAVEALARAVERGGALEGMALSGEAFVPAGGDVADATEEHVRAAFGLP